MKYLSDKDYHEELERIKKHNQQLEYRNDLKKEKQRYSNKFKIETSKLIAIYLFFLFNAIVIYAMISMWHFMDLSCLNLLISDIAGQVIIYAIYCLKAYKAKKSEEELKFEKEKYNSNFNICDDLYITDENKDSVG